MVEPVLTIYVGISRPTEVVLQERASKPPKGAVVKSYGAERLGKVHPRGVTGKDKGDERK